MAKKKGQGQKAAANDIETDDDQVDQAEASSMVQQNYQDQGQASAPASEPPKPEPARGKRPPAGAYENHPKFAKFKKGT